MDTEFVLADLKLWMERHLENLHARQNKTGYPPGGNNANGYAVAEIPDWELRQKLANVEEALKNEAWSREGWWL